MKITILTDNTPCPAKPELIAEHGLSMCIEEGGRRILCDMGLGTAFWHNAELLGLHLEELDAAFVSHGHKDHSGGLRTFLEHTSEIPVYLSPAVFHHHFFTSRHAEKRDISTDGQLLENYADRLKCCADSCGMKKDVAVVRCMTHQWATPVGNVFLTAQAEGGEERADDFGHELSLAFRTPKGLIIVSSCSHNGALNIIASCKAFTKEDRVYAFVGGLHFVDCHRTTEEVEEFQKDWNRLYPDTLLYTGHCTSDKAKLELEKVIPKVHFFHTGKTIVINPSAADKKICLNRDTP